MGTRKITKINWIVADFETDPFEYEVKPEVFLSGVCDGVKTIQWWEDGVNAFCTYLKSFDTPTYIFFHNGGKFDFFFLPWPLSDPIRIINGRIVSARIGIHTLRDSFAFLPFAMAQYKKTEIDYQKFTKENREEHRAEIEQYHRDDLVNLHELCAAFIERFGLRMTIAGTAIRELNKIHPVERKGQSHDEKFRKYYVGGRVECFERGSLKGQWKLYDVNSMYPAAMSNRHHPIGRDYGFTSDPVQLVGSDKPGFATVEGFSYGAFPFKTPEGRLTFPHAAGVYHVTLWELREATQLGLFDLDDIHEGYVSEENANFAEFVSAFSTEKIQAKASGDRIGELFAKLMLNSAYGKFGANPENYYDYRFLLADSPFPPGWELFEDWGWLIIVRIPSPMRANSYYDVATAASITGAARAMLLRALHNAKCPIYCDTDSIICEQLNSPISEKLGDWKLECEADTAIIIEKKLYALSQKGKLIKSANKGVQMDLKDFHAIIRGEDYTYKRDAPTFKKDGSVTFLNRTIKGIAK